jgi:hypothetical protein
VMPDDLLMALGMDGDGNVVAVWRRSAGDMHEIWSNGYSVDSGWSDAVKISSGVGVSWGANIAVNRAGDAVAAWSHDSGGDGVNLVWTNRYTPGTGWGDAELVHPTTQAYNQAEVVIDGEGNAIVVWASSHWTTAEAATWNYWLSSPSE